MSGEPADDRLWIAPSPSVDWSYDLRDAATKLVPQGLAQGRWHFVLGDAITTVPSAPDFDEVSADLKRPFMRGARIR